MGVSIYPVNTTMLKGPKYQRGIIGMAAAGTMSGAKTIAGTAAGGGGPVALTGIASLSEYKLSGSGLWYNGFSANMALPDDDGDSLILGALALRDMIHFDLPGSPVTNNYIPSLRTATTTTVNNLESSQVRGGVWISNGTAFVGCRYEGDNISEYTNDGPAYNPGADELETRPKTLSLPSGVVEPVDLCFSDGGTKLYVSCRGGADANADIYKYDLSTPYDIDTATEDVGNTVAIPGMRGIQVAEDGTYLWITNTTTGRLEVFNLSTAHDLTTAAIGSPIGDNSLPCDDSTLMALSTAGSINTSLDFTRVYIAWFENAQAATQVQVLEYQGGGPGGWANAPHNINQYIERSDSLQYDHDELRGMLWNDDGTRLYTVGTLDNEIRFNRVDFTTPYTIEARNPNTGSPLPLKAATLVTLGGNPMDLAWGQNGESIYVADYVALTIREYQNAGPPYNPGEGDIVGSPILAELNTSQACRSVDISPDGTEIMYVSNSTRDIYTRTLSTPWDITTAGTEISYTTGADLLSAKFSPNGLMIVGVNSNTRNVERFHLSRAYDIRSQTLTQNCEEKVPLTTALTQGTEGYVILSPDGSILTVSHFNATTGYLSDYLAP